MGTYGAADIALVCLGIRLVTSDKHLLHATSSLVAVEQCPGISLCDTVVEEKDTLIRLHDADSREIFNKADLEVDRTKPGYGNETHQDN